MPQSTLTERLRQTSVSDMTPVERLITDPVRVAAVRATGLLDAPPSAVLDELCAAAAATVEADAVTVSLLDEHRQWFAGAYGLPDPWATTRETDLDASLCQHIGAPAEPLAVTDVLDGEADCHRPASELGIRSHLAYALCTHDGTILGALGASRRRPSTWSAIDHASLRALATVCERYLRNDVVTRHDPSHDLAMVAHDIRNPLTVLKGVATVLPGVNDSATRDQLAAMIERATNAVDNLVEDLVTAGVPTNQTIPVRREQFDLVATVDAVVEGTPFGRGRIVTDLPEQALIYADERAVTRILTNLVENARRHGVPPIGIAVRAEPGEVVIEVTNEGQRIPDDARPHLFTRFRPGTASTSGSGLGLHIVQRLAAAHQGTVVLVDGPGPTCMRVSLPQRAATR